MLEEPQQQTAIEIWPLMEDEVTGHFRPSAKN